MRFRATVDNVPTFYREQITQSSFIIADQVLKGIVQAIEKLQKRLILKFSDETMQIICNDTSNDGGVEVWS
jgi:HUS1 checkpoint protein